MPKELDRCVKKLKEKGYDKQKAWKMCIESTGWRPKKGGGWTKEKRKRRVKQ